MVFCLVLAASGCGPSDCEDGTGGTAGSGGEGGTIPPPCPDPTGQFNITQASQCFDLDTAADQQILMATGICNFEFQSGVPTGPLGLNGFFLLDMAGTFTNVNLQVGTATAPCSGVWTEPTMMVTCGDCTIELVER